MAFQTTFKRYEIKYMITREQKARILAAMEPYMVIDKFGRSTIRNIYFDTDDRILARHSIARPDFKEKLRIRSYAQADSESTVFVELKRKYDHVVYKRRIALPEADAMNWTQSFASAARGKTQISSVASMRRSGRAGIDPQVNGDTDAAASQMQREIDYFLSYYGSLRPAAFLSYEREAYKVRPSSPATGIQPGVSGTVNGPHKPAASSQITYPTPDDFRVTFDDNILFRDFDLSLRSDVYGTPLLRDGMVLMELKCSGGIPMWMVQVLSEEHIYKTSYSKYGTAYTNFIQPKLVRTPAVARQQISAGQLASAPQAAAGKLARARSRAAAAKHTPQFSSSRNSNRKRAGSTRSASACVHYQSV